MLDELEELNGRRERDGRAEQGIIRALLLDGEELGLCALCGEEYPVQFWWPPPLSVGRSARMRKSGISRTSCWPANWV
jgi:hypothetical protein